ncbi:MAG: hypothetical protein RML36_02245 [Anaerolineae bacterium]|nr:hypothetical protein [Anaerolineae bacterium]
MSVITVVFPNLDRPRRRWQLVIAAMARPSSFHKFSTIVGYDRAGSEGSDEKQVSRTI